MAVRGDIDLRTKLRKSSADFHKAGHMWRHDMISMKDKFRMLMRYIQQMIYGGAVTWFLDGSTCEALNGWSSDKTSINTGNSRREENRKRTLDVERAICYHRHKRVGEVMRAPHRHVDKAELILHARQVRYGIFPRVGSLVMDVPEYDNEEQLMVKAGYCPPPRLTTRWHGHNNMAEILRY